MQCACQIHVALRMGACDRLIFRMMSEVFSVEVLFQVATAMVRPQALHCRQFLVAKAENALGGFAFEREGFGKSWRRVLFFELGLRRGALSTAETPAFL